MNKWQKAYLRGAYRGKSPGALYRERLGTVQDALDWIDDGDCLTWSTHGSEPKVFLEHLHTIAPRLEKGIDCWNTISRYDYPVTRDPALAGRFRHHTFFFDRWSVAARGSGLYSYFPVNQHNYGQEVRRCLPPNVFVAQVSPMDRHGYVHLSCDLIMTLEHVYRADKIIFEVNARAPMVWGESALPISMADVVYEVDEPIFQLQDPPIGEREETIAGYVSDLMRDGDCIQLGFGGIPNAIGFHLMEKHDLGIHTEQIGTAMAHLMACGAVTNRCKTIDRGITVGSFISGDHFLYDFVDQHPRLTVRRSRYTNDP